MVEKEESISVVRFGGQWKDLGTWNTLTEAMEENVIGEALLNDKCDGVHVIIGAAAAHMEAIAVVNPNGAVTHGVGTSKAGNSGCLGGGVAFSIDCVVVCFAREVSDEAGGSALHASGPC